MSNNFYRTLNDVQNNNNFLESRKCYLILSFILFFAVGLPMYFVGYSKDIGGLPMKLIDVKITKICYMLKCNNNNNNKCDDGSGYYEMKGIPMNMNASSYTINTGYDFTSKSYCEAVFHKRYIIGNIYKMYYNYVNNEIYTQTYSNMLSWIGFIFIIISCSVAIYYLIESCYFNFKKKNYLSDNYVYNAIHQYILQNNISQVSVASTIMKPIIIVPHNAIDSNIELSITNKNNIICPICLQEINSKKIFLMCGHNFHCKCLNEWLENKNKDNCPLCRYEV